MEIKAAKVTTTLSNLKTKEKYKTEEEWKAKGIPEKDIRRDVHVLMPKLDLFGKTKQVQNLGEIMTKSHRQRYGFGSFIKKITRPVKKVAKKVWKSPLGKAAIIGGGLWGLNKWGPLAGRMTGGGNWLSKLGGGAWNWAKANPGKAGLLGLGAAGTILPFMGDDEEEIVEEGWENTPSSIAAITQMAKDRHPSINFLE